MPGLGSQLQNPTKMLQASKPAGNYDLVDFIIFVGIALVFDLVSVIPLMGTIGILLFRFIFYLKNINTPAINLLMGTGGLTEIIPVVSFLPCVTAFVVIVYIQTQLQKRLAKKLAKIAPVARELNKYSAALGPEAKLITEGVVAADNVVNQGQDPKEAVAKGAMSALSGGAAGAKGAQTGASGSPLVEGQPYAQPDDKTAAKKGSSQSNEQKNGASESRQNAEGGDVSSPSESGPTAEGGRFPEKKSPLITDPTSAQMDVPERNRVDLRKQKKAT